MQITPIGNRGRLISYPELGITNTYLILAPKASYLCDTFLGPQAMQPIQQLLAAEGRTQPLVIFNTHKDWDHVWGNCAFPNATIVATETCRANMAKHFDEEWEAFGEQAQGQVRPVLPNLTFSGRLHFVPDEVLIFSSPGHTDGSASCFDLQDRVLVAGDNLEAPLPYLFSADLESYQRTLEHYLSLEPSQLITGHGALDTMTPQLLKGNLAYVRSLAAGEEPDQSQWSEQARQLHQGNLSRLAASG